MLGVEQAGPIVWHEVAAAAKHVDADGEGGELEVSESRHWLDLSLHAHLVKC